MSQHSPLQQNRQKIYNSYHLAYRTRLRVLQKIVQFDVNHLGMIQYPEICSALQCILGEGRKEVETISQALIEQRGNTVSYEDIVNACLQEGLEIAAATKVNPEGNNPQAAITESSFMEILKYPLQSLGVQTDPAEFSDLFRQICRENDTSITLIDYVTFVREYFGRNCIAGDKVIKPLSTKPIQTTAQYEKAVLRIGKLLWSQYKDQIMQLDTLHNRQFNSATVLQNLQRKFSIKLNMQEEYGYDGILKAIVEQKFTNFNFPLTQKLQTLSKEAFIEIFYRYQASQIKNKTSPYLLQEIFDHLSGKAPFLSLQSYLVFLVNLGNTYQPIGSASLGQKNF